MRLIAHRGLLRGPNEYTENDPSQINWALSKGFNVEVDIHFHEGEWFTGHDKPLYKVTLEWLSNPNFWLHCKNEEAFEKMTFLSPQLHYFWHDKDTYTMTSAGIPWIYPGEKIIKTGICVMPELNYKLKEAAKLSVYGFCSDYIEEIAEILKCK